MIPTSDQLDRNAFLEASRLVESGEAPIHTKFQKRFTPFLLEHLRDHYQNLPEPVIDVKWEGKFKSVLRKLQHHDEYFLIIDLRNLSVEWIYGLENALGYPPETRKKWTIGHQHQIVHDDYFSMFSSFAALTNRILVEQNEKLVPLQHRYVINLPLRKADDSYVWAKQMSLPLSVDTQGRMIRQLNSYTIISHFDGVYLPSTPLLFRPDGSRARELERTIFDRYAAASLFAPKEMELLVASTALNIWKEKNAAITQSSARKNISVKYFEIATRLGRTEGAVHSDADRLKGKIAASFDIRPTDIVETAMLLKRMHRF